MKLRTLTLGLLLLASPALAQTTPAPADPTPPPVAPVTTPAPVPSPATPAPVQTPVPPAPATTPAPATNTAPAMTSAAPGARNVKLPTLEGEKVLRTVQTVLGEAIIYAGSVKDALARTVTALVAQGYATGAGNPASTTGAVLTHDGQSLNLTIKEQLGLTVVSLAIDPKGMSVKVPTAAPSPADTSTPATPATDPATPAPPADSGTTPPPTTPPPSSP